MLNRENMLKYVSQLKLTNNLQNDTNKFYYDDQC